METARGPQDVAGTRGEDFRWTQERERGESGGRRFLRKAGAGMERGRRGERRGFPAASALRSESAAVDAGA